MLRMICPMFDLKTCEATMMDVSRNARKLALIMLTCVHEIQQLLKRRVHHAYTHMMDGRQREAVSHSDVMVAAHGCRFSTTATKVKPLPKQFGVLPEKGQ